MNSNIILTDKSPPPDYRCLMKPLREIWKNPDELKVIEDAVFRTDSIVIKSYMLLNLFVYESYQDLLKNSKILEIKDDNEVITYKTELEPISTFIDESLIKSCQNALSIKKAGPKNKNPMFQQFQELIKKIPNFDLENASYLSQILQEEAKTMIVAIENNIKNNFLQHYVNRFINSVFEFKSKNKFERKEINKIKKDILNNTLTSNQKYHRWINKYRHFIVPTLEEDCKGYYYDIQVNPQKYISNMIWVNSYFESKGERLYQVMPMRNNGIGHYIQIDTVSLIKLFIHDDVTDFTENVSELSTKLWQTYIHKIPKINKEYVFSNCIISNGISCAVRYIEKNRKIQKEIEDDRKRQAKKQPKEVKVAKKALKLKIEEDKEKLEIIKKKQKKELDNLTIQFKNKHQLETDMLKVLKENNKKEYTKQNKLFTQTKKSDNETIEELKSKRFRNLFRK